MKQLYYLKWLFTIQQRLSASSWVLFIWWAIRDSSGYWSILWSVGFPCHIRTTAAGSKHRCRCRNRWVEINRNLSSRDKIIEWIIFSTWLVLCNTFSPPSNIFSWKDLPLISWSPLVPPVGQREGCLETYYRVRAVKQKRIPTCAARGGGEEDQATHSSPAPEACATR